MKQNCGQKTYGIVCAKCNKKGYFNSNTEFIAFIPTTGGAPKFVCKTCCEKLGIVINKIK